MKAPAKERFLRHVQKTSTCWWWTGAKHKDGYGEFTLHNLEAAHRAAYLLFKGPIPKKKFVLHRCDERLCVRPSHLFIGTHQNNMDDMVRKKRGTNGSKNSHCKLSTQQVLEIRNKAQKGGYGIVARQYGVHRVTIGQIMRKERRRVA